MLSLDTNVVTVLTVFGFLFCVPFWLLTLPAVIYRWRTLGDRYAWLRWIFSPALVMARFLFWRLFWVAFCLGGLMVLMVLGPIYVLILRPVYRAFQALVARSRGFYAALRSMRAFIAYFEPLIRFGERALFYRDWLPGFLADRPEFSGVVLRRPAGTSPAPGSASRRAENPYRYASQTGPAGD